MTYSEDKWLKTPINPAGKKYPEVRLNPAICFLTDSLLLHGGLTLGSSKQKALGDFYILQSL
jgi:hypothetical protein